MAQRYAFDRTIRREFMEDFDSFEVDQWIVTETGSGTRAIGDIGNGVLVITNAAGASDLNYLQYSGDDDTGTAETFAFVVGKSFYFAARFKIGEVIQHNFAIGLQITDTSPLAVTDGIWFGSDDGDALLDFHVAASSAQTDATGIATLVADTWTKVAFYYDGRGSKIVALVDDVIVGSAVITNAPTTELTISIANGNGEAVAHVLSVDYVFVSKER